MDADEEEEEEEDDDDASRGELLPVDKGRLTLPSSKRGTRETIGRILAINPLKIVYCYYYVLNYPSDFMTVNFVHHWKRWRDRILSKIKISGYA